jgi:hypothetical protein
MVDPSDDSPPRFLPYRKEPEVVQWDWISDYFEDEDHGNEQKPDKMVLGFDLNWPLTPQLDTARRFLQAKAGAYGVGPRTGQGETVQKSKLRLYLRILDADTAGATNKAIASVLLPHEPNDAASGYHDTKKISDWLKQAERVRNKPQLCLRL